MLQTTRQWKWRNRDCLQKQKRRPARVEVEVERGAPIAYGVHRLMTTINVRPFLVIGQMLTIITDGDSKCLNRIQDFMDEWDNLGVIC